VAPRLTQSQKTLPLRLRRRGLSQREIARQICCNDSTLSIMFREMLSSEGIAERWAPRPTPRTCKSDNPTNKWWQRITGLLMKLTLCLPSVADVSLTSVVVQVCH
jgi:hypothetical protein